MAVRLEYDSCMFEEAFDAGVDDMTKVQEKRRQQQEEIAAFEQAQHDAKEQAEAEGETFTPEERTWEKIEAQPFKTRKVSYVVCLNTLG